MMVRLAVRRLLPSAAAALTSSPGGRLSFLFYLKFIYSRNEKSGLLVFDQFKGVTYSLTDISRIL